MNKIERLRHNLEMADHYLGLASVEQPGTETFTYWRNQCRKWTAKLNREKELEANAPTLVSVLDHAQALLEGARIDHHKFDRDAAALIDALMEYGDEEQANRIYCLTERVYNELH